MSEAAPSAAVAPGVKRCLRLVPLLLVALAAAAVFASGAYDRLSLDALVRDRDVLAAFVAAHRAMAVAVFAAVYLLLVVAAVPGTSLMTVAGGFLFGGLTGALVSAAAATLGAVGLFLVARTSLGAFLRGRLGDSLERFRDSFEQNAVSYMLFLRLTPLFPFWMVNLAAPLLRVPLWTFAWTTLVGILPAGLAFAYAGAGLGRAVAQQQRLYEACLAAGHPACRMTMPLSALLTRNTLAALAFLGLVSLVPVLLRRRRRRAAAGPP